MHLTKDNYLAHRDQIDWSRFPAALTGETKSLVDDVAADGFKDTNTEVVEAVDKFFKLSNMLIARDGTLVGGGHHEPKEEKKDAPREKPPVEKKTPAPKPKRAPRKPKVPVVKRVAPKPEPKPKKDPFHGKPVEHIASDVNFIKRYVSLHGKVKTSDDLSRLLHGLQKAVIERRITRKSQWAQELAEMQDSLVKAIKSLGGAGTIKVEIAAKSLRHYQDIAKSEEARVSVKLLKQYIALSGKRGMKMKARKLKEAMWKAVDAGKVKEGDPYQEQLDAAWRSLNIFCDEKVPVLDLHEYELAGLGSITGKVVDAPGGALSGIHTKSPSLFSKSAPAHQAHRSSDKKKVRA